MMLVSDWFSQTRAVRARKERGLHPVSEVNRFAILVCGLFCGICVSLTYAYDLFTTQFRDQFQLSAGDLSTVSTVGLVFCYFLLPYSLIFETMGPFLNFVICLVTGVIGTVCLALTFTGKIPGNTATITVFYAFLNTASGLIDTTYVSTLFEIFPRNRGPVVCLAKVMTGLGSTIFACLSTTFFKDDIVGFIYFLCAVIAVVTVCAGFVIVLPPYYMNWWRLRNKDLEEVAELAATKPLYHHKSVPMRRLAVGYAVVITMILFFTIETPIVSFVHSVSRGSEIGIGVIAVMLTLCLFLMVLPLRCLGGIDEPAPTDEEVRAIAQLYATPRETSSDDGAVESEVTLNKPAVVAAAVAAQGDSPTNSEPVAAPGTEEEAEKDRYARQDPRYQGTTVMDYIKSPDLWFILLYMFCIAPIGIMVSYNGSTVSIAKTGEARSAQTSALYTAFLGLGNSVGRMAFGLFEAYVQYQRGRGGKLLVTTALFVCPVIATVGGVLLLVLPGKVILLPYILVYITNGFNAALQALIFTCLFERFHNTLYNMGFMVTVICVICFNRLLFGMYVDMKHRQLGLSAAQECNTAVCIQVPFIVSTCLAAAGLIFAALVHVRYARYVARVRKQSEEKAAERSSEGEFVELQEGL
ncbi:hypothetical protein ABB37_06490 [Leptomonas pyrrhocoris]|uniref:Nodulin-like domain-containing protein n=1 Tax=Leptomonas pyrrhocoris TaxID=157538 RepID=A0A0N0VEH2_LEPPY|nr:hypothetical protein ABB37_06490 [Leptomonas pyrrhocoris]XP_015656810.1 hypothetical protein ABB37_06490 [Leptomonas pyrrhocoris]KPA78370.1 hypothetical protein ABB37_06490 [Leptomonas pyrrhocoris]KPA78371.1 hypothetical protein ABB37_06490 [Leptomonas pyrrhocoris]|eukprot:XP_015656809.1 hypothetical protein ABB37_06490 [Leptomonas pyrrhocoris]